jgi:branched-chain amino acid transport system substrate-binding protein
MFRKLMSGTLMLAITVCLSWLVNPSAAAESIKIGANITTTGSAAWVGESTFEGVKFAVEEMNGKGGIEIAGKPYKIELVHYDDRCKAQDAQANIQRLIFNDKVNLLVTGPCSHSTLAAMEISNPEKIPLVCIVGSDPNITEKGYRYVMRTGAVTADFVRTGVVFLLEKMKVKTLAIVARNDPWGKSVAQEMQNRINAGGGKVVHTDFYEHGESDFHPILTKIKAMEPDAVMLVSQVEEGVILVKQARELKLKSILMGAGAMVGKEFLKLAGESAEGLYELSWMGQPGALLTEFEKRFKEKTGKEAIEFHRRGYDSILLIGKAMQSAGAVANPDKVRDALMKTSFDGLQGNYTFDEKGQARCRISVIRFTKDSVERVE